MNEQTRIRRLEDAFAKEHDYSFDEGDMTKASHGRHLLPGVRLYVGDTLPDVDSGYTMAFVTTTSTLNILVDDAWEAVGGGA